MLDDSQEDPKGPVRDKSQAKMAQASSDAAIQFYDDKTTNQQEDHITIEVTNTDQNYSDEEGEESEIDNISEIQNTEEQSSLKSKQTR